MKLLFAVVLAVCLAVAVADPCTSVVPLNVTGGSINGTAVGPSDTFLNSSISCRDGGLEVMYSIVLQPRERLTAYATPDGGDVYQGIYSGACGSLTAISCADESEVVAYNYESVPTTFHIGVWNYYDTGVDTNYTLDYTVESHGPCDVVANATEGKVIVSSNPLANETNTAWFVGFGGQEVLVKISVPAYKIVSAVISNRTEGVSLYHGAWFGSCGNFGDSESLDYQSTDSTEVTYSNQEAVAVDVYLAVWSVSSGSSYGTWWADLDITLTDGPVPPCGDVTAVTAVATGGLIEGYINATGNTEYYTDKYCSGSGLEHFYSLEVPASSRVLYWVRNNTADLVHGLFNATCSSSVDSTNCADPETSILSWENTAAVAATAHLGIWTYSSGLEANYTLEYAFDHSPCQNVVALNNSHGTHVVNIDAFYNYRYFDNACGSMDGKEYLWSVSVPAGGNFSFWVSNSSIDGSSVDVVHAIFTGTCGSWTAVACDDPDSTVSFYANTGSSAVTVYAAIGSYSTATGHVEFEYEVGGFVDAESSTGDVSSGFAPQVTIMSLLALIVPALLSRFIY